jgi:hypothetical protein
MNILLENISHDEMKSTMREFYAYAKERMGLTRKPKVIFVKDQQNADDFLGKTGYYNPEKESIHLFITDRHPKDIIRSFSHELVHHMQKIKGLDRNLNLSATSDPAYASHDEGLRKMEKQAFTIGNMIFRDWCDMKKVERKNIMSEKMDSLENPDKDLNNDGTSDEGDIVIAKRRLAIAKKKGDEKLIKIYQDLIDELKGHEKEVEEGSIAAAAQQHAKSHTQNKYHPSNEDASYGSEERKGITTESKQREPEIVHPYPELFARKERLMKDEFNKHEDILYQELMRKIIKKEQK